MRCCESLGTVGVSRRQPLEKKRRHSELAKDLRAAWSIRGSSDGEGGDVDTGGGELEGDRGVPITGGQGHLDAGHRGEVLEQFQHSAPRLEGEWVRAVGEAETAKILVVDA